MTKILLPRIASFLLLSVGAIGYAQQPAPPPTPQQQPGPQGQRDRSEGPATPATLKGCLTKGAQAQQYMVADEATGQSVSFAAPDKLATYVNQTVELKGQFVEQGGAKTFQPESVKSVAPSCAK
jgi:hypothetical protein